MKSGGPPLEWPECWSFKKKEKGWEWLSPLPLRHHHHHHHYHLLMLLRRVFFFFFFLFFLSEQRRNQAARDAIILCLSLSTDLLWRRHKTPRWSGREILMEGGSRGGRRRGGGGWGGGEAGVYGESTFPSEALTLNRCDKVGLWCLAEGGSEGGMEGRESWRRAKSRRKQRAQRQGPIKCPINEFSRLINWSPTRGAGQV